MEMDVIDVVELDVSDSEVLEFLTARMDSLCEWELKLWRILRRDVLRTQGDDDAR